MAHLKVPKRRIKLIRGQLDGARTDLHRAVASLDGDALANVFGRLELLLHPRTASRKPAAGQRDKRAY